MRLPKYGRAVPTKERSNSPWPGKKKSISTLLWKESNGYFTLMTKTILVEGPLGEFGMQWIVLESVFCGVALVLLSLYKKLNPVA